MAGRAPIEARLRSLYTATSSEHYGLITRQGMILAIKNQPPREQPLLVLLESTDDLASERVLLDPNQLDPSGSTTIDFYEPSLDGRLVAVSLSEHGSEEGTLHIYLKVVGFGEAGCPLGASPRSISSGSLRRQSRRSEPEDKECWRACSPPDLPLAVESMTKTNAVRMLDKAGIAYELRAYDIDESDLSAERAAAKLGMAPETVFKTLITRGDRSGPVLACIPAGTELDLRALGEASGNKRVEMAPLREVLDLTGYIRGAVTPLATKKPFPVFIDETAELWPVVGISGGLRGLEILLAPADLIRLTGARLADIARQT